PTGTPPDVVAAMATASKEVLSEPATAAQLKETQHMTLLLQDGAAFKTFFDKQVAYWGQGGEGQQYQGVRARWLSSAGG
ncbi:hypothetical protein SE91_29445, partial [Bradyrhizobium sp. DOA1]